MKVITFDLETTGIPVRYGNKYAPENTSLFDQARIVSISWLIAEDNVVTKHTHYVIRPEGFSIPQQSTAIHGISHEQAVSEGHSFDLILGGEFLTDLRQADFLVAHNIDFDYNVLKSEFIRRGYPSETILDNIPQICTCKAGQRIMKLRWRPKLVDLYKSLFGTEIEGTAHNAMYDTLACYRVAVELKNKTGGWEQLTDVVLPEKEPIALSEEQRGVVYEDLGKNMLVVACAGSGKTTTILCRIWWLLRNGVDPESITLTTFTRFAAEDMRSKLGELLGFVPPIEIGTIDSIALRNLRMIDPNNDTPFFGRTSRAFESVSEYSLRFLEMLQNNDLRTKILSGKRYLFVDEFQDINETQFDIIYKYSEFGVKVIAIGDDAQNIYSFRKSTVKYILNFAEYFPSHAFHTLTVNYRSTPGIVELANASIENNTNQMPKQMVACDENIQVAEKRSPQTRLPHVRHFASSLLQNEFVSERIQVYHEKGYKYDDIAVLCHQNGMLFSLEEMLTRVGIPNVFVDSKKQSGGNAHDNKKKPGHVFLGTIHKAKGLEWKIVFLVNMNDEVFPHNKNYDIEEVRRLFYVGVTRARDFLHIYYPTMNGKSFITRFVSELPRTLYNFWNFRDSLIGTSKNSYVNLKLGVTSILESLEPTDYKWIREQVAEGVPDFKRVALYPCGTHSQFVLENNLTADFGIFMDYFVCRLASSNVPQAPKIALASVKLNREEYEVYQKYRYNFAINLSQNVTVEELGRPNKNVLINPIRDYDAPMVVQILLAIKTKAQEFGLPVEKISVMTERFLPLNFEKNVAKSLANYKNKSIGWRDALWDIWNVAKCEKIVRDRRRRLLYKKMPATFFDHYLPILESVVQHFPNQIGGHCHETLTDGNGITGELDLRFDDTIIDIKCSSDPTVQADWAIQLLCYTALARANGIIVNKIAVFNPLLGIYSQTDVSEWRGDQGLLGYLSSKRI
jgi:DNA polymerase III epsilon subunit-like protein